MLHSALSATASPLALVIALQMLLSACQQPEVLSEAATASSTETLPPILPSSWRLEIPVSPSQIKPSGDADDAKLRYGFIDKTGKFVIPPKFKGAGSFMCGLATVATDAGSAYIDKSGRFVTKPGEFTDVGGINYCTGNDVDDLYLVRQDVQIPASEGSKSQRQTKQYYGYVNLKGKLVIPLTSYSMAYGFSNGMAKVHILTKPTPDEIAESRQRRKGEGDPPGLRYGYIDAKGKLVILPKFDRAGDFRWGVAQVGIKRFESASYDPKQKVAVIDYGLIDKEGRYFIEPQKDSEKTCKAAKLLSKQSELRGKDAIKLNFPTIDQLCGGPSYEYKRDGFIAASQPMPPSTTLTDEYLTNNAGKKLFPSQLDGAVPYYQNPSGNYDIPVSEGLALIQRDDGYYCYINNQGTFIIPCKFKEASTFSEGLAAVAVAVDPEKR